MLEPYSNQPYQEPDAGVLVVAGIIGGVIGLVGGGVIGYLIAERVGLAKTGLEAGESIIEKIVKEI